MDSFLYDRGLSHERVKEGSYRISKENSLARIYSVIGFRRYWKPNTRS